MTDLDDLLEERLRDLDRGLPLEEVVQLVPPEAAEILPLLRRAAVTREVSQPSMASSKARAQRGEIMKFARSNAQPERRFSLRFALTQLSMAMVLVVVALLTIGLTGPRGSRSATLTDVNGVVEVFDGQNWQAASTGDRVKSGQKVRTQLGSQATLVFFEGTRSVLAEDTELDLSKVQGGWNQSLRVQMRQVMGVSTHTVTPVKENGQFVIDTDYGQAIVRGTIFDVEITDGRSRFSVRRGEVEVTYGQDQVILTAGQAVVVEEGVTLLEPANKFDILGPIEQIIGNTWTVAGLDILVDPVLAADRDWHLGDWVTVQGHILKDGSLVADLVRLAKNEKELAHFTGTIESMGLDAWLVSGKLVIVDAATQIEPGLRVGDPVEVAFVVMEDGSWLAVEIVSLAETEEPAETATGSSPVTTATPTKKATPGPTLPLSPQPSQTTTPRTPTVTPTANVPANPTASPVTGCGVGEEQPEAITLAKRYNVTYTEIIHWFCQGYGFGEIDLAYQLAQNAGVPVEEVFEMVESGMGWGLIKQTLEPVVSTPAPTNTVQPSKTPEPTSTPKPTKEEKPTDEPKPTKEEKPTDEPKPTKDK